MIVHNLAAIIGAAVILTDPIFQGLAISLLFGLASSTLLTVLVIPAIYIWLRGDKPVLLIDGAASSVTQDTLDTMTYLGVTKVLVAGGLGAVQILEVTL
mgnify:CR=1 FL=1